MGTFKTFCGHEFQINHNCFMSGILIARKYPENLKDDDIPLGEKCAKCNACKKTNDVSLFDEKTHKSFTASDTVCFAHNVDFKERDLADYYDEPSSNTKERMTFEVVLQTGDLRTYVYHTVDSRTTSAYDHMQELVEDLWKEYRRKGKSKGYIQIPMVSLKTGSFDLIEVDRLADFERMVVSMRLVEYKSEIVEIS